MVADETLFRPPTAKEFAGIIALDLRRRLCFATQEPGELDAVRPYFRGVDRVAALPRGAFIAYNRESGEELAGRLF